MAQAVKAATGCMLAANKSGVDKTRFDSDPSWQRLADGGYSAVDLPVTVSFPKDADGIARVCVVEATLPSRNDQREMQSALETLLKRKPFKQSDSMIWMFGAGANARGLQYYPGEKSEQPQIRFVGAEF